MIQKLNGISVFEATYILSVTKEIAKNKNPEIQKWREELERAVFSGNDKLYRDFLNSLNQ